MAGRIWNDFRGKLSGDFWRPRVQFFPFVYSARLAVSFAGFTHAKSAGKKTVREDREVGTWFCADARWRILVSGLGAG